MPSFAARNGVSAGIAAAAMAGNAGRFAFATDTYMSIANDVRRRHGAGVHQLDRPMLQSDLSCAPETAPNAPLVTSPRMVLAAMLAAVAIFDCVFYTGYYACDDALYFRTATSLLETGRITDVSDVGSLRLVMVGWCWLVARFVSTNVHVMATSFVLFHLALMVLSYRLASRYYELRTGLVAAWLVGTVPLILHHATQIHTDTPLACFMLLAVLLMIEAYAARGPWWTGLRLAGAGLAVGLAYSVKESGLILLPWCFAYWLIREIQFFRAASSNADEPSASKSMRVTAALSRGSMFLAGFALVFVGESVLIRVLSESDSHRLSWTATASAAGAEAKYLIDGGASPLGRLRGFLRQLDFLHFPLSLRVILAASLLTYPLLRLRRWAVPLAGLWIFAYLTWGSVSLNRYLPPSMHPRYFIPALPFLVITASAVLVCLFDAARRIRFAPRLVRTGGGLALASLIMVPMLNLDAADRIAGRGSRASFVSSAAEAIRIARMAGRGADRPVVLAGLVTMHLRPAFYSGRPADILLADELSPLDVRELLDGGGFFYIDDNRRDLLRREAIPSSAIDDLMHNATLMGGDWDDCTVALTTVWPEVLLASAGDHVTWELPPQTDLKIVRLANVAPPPSRIGDFLARYVRHISDGPVACDPAFSVDLFRVTAESRNHLAAVESAEDQIAGGLVLHRLAD